MRKYREYTDEQVINYAKEVYSIAELLKRLNLTLAGGNYVNIKKILSELKIDTSHWKGQGWNKNKKLKDWSNYSRIQHLKKHLIKEKGHKCENCLLTEWQNFPIILEIHHKDGNKQNNDIENLQILCCNCHSLTHNWKGKNRNKI
jgi:hypothetical protein